MSEQTREQYFKHYQDLGKVMFEKCTIPTVADFANAYNTKKPDKKALDKITQITEYTGNTSSIAKSVSRRNDNYSEKDSADFMADVIAANVTDITQSGYFYKKLVSSCDDMKIDSDDCGSTGEEMKLPIDETTFIYKVRNHYITELGKYVESIDELPKKGTIHVRSFLTCKHDDKMRTFCKKCAGLFRRSANTNFVPKYIGIYSTLMITEHATQASLDSMNKGSGSEKVNVVLETKLDGICKSFDDAKIKIKEIIDTIGWQGVESRFYEVALLSRWRFNGNRWDFVLLPNSIKHQSDVLGAFIFTPNEKMFKKLLLAGTFDAFSTRTRIAFDNYEDITDDYYYGDPAYNTSEEDDSSES